VGVLDIGEGRLARLSRPEQRHVPLALEDQRDLVRERLHPNDLRWVIERAVPDERIQRGDHRSIELYRLAGTEMYRLAVQAGPAPSTGAIVCLRGAGKVMRTSQELIPILYLAPRVDIGGSDKATVDWFRFIDRERFRPSLITTQPSPNRRLWEVAPYAEELWGGEDRKMRTRSRS
jgi:hypothetical protein